MEKRLNSVLSYLTKDWAKAMDNIDSIQSDLLRLSGFSDIRSFCREISKRTISLTFFAGAGARWVNSIYDADEGLRCRFNPEHPRCMAPVKNLITHGSSSLIPVGIYNLGAVRNMARNIVIYRGSSDLIQHQIADYLDLVPVYLEQSIPCEVGKPLGHGDAALQSIDHISESNYVITNFAGDVNSKKTITLSLLAMFVLEKYGREVDLILPTTFMDRPKYPVIVSKEGYPVYFSQSKLKGDKQVTKKGQSNIGVRVYRTAGFIRHMRQFQQVYREQGSYSSINNGNNELALDNIDEAIAKENKALSFCIALPEEITPIKMVSDIPMFEAAMEKVLIRDRTL